LGIVEDLFVQQRALRRARATNSIVCTSLQ
jgi:hypothetical protein